MLESKIKKFIYKGQYLDVELNETNELYEIYNDMFKKDFFAELAYLRKRSEKLNKEMNKTDLDENNDEPIDDELKEEPDDQEELEEPEDNDEIDMNIEIKFMKNLYRKITIKTHPDKTNDTDLHEIFKQADIAYKEENLLDLLIIAIQLRIKYPKMDFDISQKLQKDIKAKENKIEDIKSTVAWNWGNKSDDPEEKEKLKKYLYGIWGLPDDFHENPDYKI